MIAKDPANKARISVHIHVPGDEPETLVKHWGVDEWKKFFKAMIPFLSVRIRLSLKPSNRKRKSSFTGKKSAPVQATKQRRVSFARPLSGKANVSLASAAMKSSSTGGRHRTSPYSK